MKIAVLVVIINLLMLSDIYGQDSVGANQQERGVLKLINSLPEIVRENKYRKQEHVKTLLKAYIQNTPTKESNYYSVSVSEDLGFQLRTYDWYDVNARTYEIRYFDIPSGKTMSLKEWRKKLHKH